MTTPVELPNIYCKNLAEVVYIRHYLKDSCKNLRFQTNLSDSGRSDISCRVRCFLQDSCRSRHFLQNSWTDLARQCLKLERYSSRKCLENTENVQIVFSILNPEYVQNECECLIYGVTSKIRHFLPSTSKIRHFLPSYFQDSHIFCKILQDQTFSSKIFQDTCKNNALYSKILEVKSDRFLQKMYGSSTGVIHT